MSQQQLPPLAAASSMEMPLPPMRASALFTEHPAHRSSSGTRPLVCGAPDCPRLAHSARRCSGLSARQGWWMGQQHRLSNRLSETVAGRPIVQIQQQAPIHPAHSSRGGCKRTIACTINPLTYPISSLMLRSDRRRCGRRPQLVLQMLDNCSATTSSGTDTNQQAAFKLGGI